MDEPVSCVPLESGGGGGGGSEPVVPESLLTVPESVSVASESESVVSSLVDASVSVSAAMSVDEEELEPEDVIPGVEVILAPLIVALERPPAFTLASGNSCIDCGITTATGAVVSSCPEGGSGLLSPPVHPTPPMRTATDP